MVFFDKDGNAWWRSCNLEFLGGSLGASSYHPSKWDIKFSWEGKWRLMTSLPTDKIIFAVFNPTTEDGTVTVDITISTEGLAEGDKIVIFEKIYDVATDEEIKNGIQTGDLLIARHEDLTDTDQTITLHYRPMTGSVTPSYTVAGCMIVTISAIAIGAWLVIARRKRIGEA